MKNISKIHLLVLIFVILRMQCAEKCVTEKLFLQKVQEHKDVIVSNGDLFAMMQKRVDESDTGFGMNKHGVIFTQAYTQCDSLPDRINHFENYGQRLLTAISSNTSEKQKLSDRVALDCSGRLAQLQFPFYFVYVSRQYLSFSLLENYSTKNERFDLTQSIIKTVKQLIFLSDIIKVESLCVSLFAIDDLLEGDYLCGAVGALVATTGFSFAWYAKNKRAKNILFKEPLTDEVVNRQMALHFDLESQLK